MRRLKENLCIQIRLYAFIAININDNILVSLTRENNNKELQKKNIKINKVSVQDKIHLDLPIYNVVKLRD